MRRKNSGTRKSERTANWCPRGNVRHLREREKIVHYAKQYNFVFLSFLRVVDFDYVIFNAIFFPNDLIIEDFFELCRRLQTTPWCAANLVFTRSVLFILRISTHDDYNTYLRSKLDEKIPTEFAVQRASALMKNFFEFLRNLLVHSCSFPNSLI